jgi:D-alanyl-D-alanine carboxypeptidase/D-alanyl-D-alanine-endopeptidase (penicillin-binding protein 4)
MKQTCVRFVALFAALGSAQLAMAKEPLQQRVEAVLAEAGPGTRFGLVVTTADGRELVAVSPTDRFIPASNTKMFPTAATFALVAGLDQPDASGGAAVRLEKSGHGTPDVILTGHGDARLSSADDCTVDCLATLADAVAAKTRHVRDVVGDDSLFPDQRWSPGMSWNNIPSAYGTAISALTLDDNETALRVTPTEVGKPPRVELSRYYAIENRAVTVAAGKTELNVQRLPGQRTILLTGAIAATDEPDLIRLGIDDPAHYAAWRLKALLEARGVKVSGDVKARHRPFMPADDPKLRGATPPVRPPQPEALARLVPPPLIEDLTLTAKVSQNLHAELFLRRLGLIEGTGSIEDGEAVIRAMLADAGVPRTGFDFSDGSGMSTYNRLAPRAVVTFLRWVAAQPWGAAWRATLPVGGVDGTLRNRFKGTELEGRLTAKTGTLNATNALSGYMIAKSGQSLTFSAFANDVPSEASALKAMDAALVLIANEN